MKPRIFRPFLLLGILTFYAYVAEASPVSALGSKEWVQSKLDAYPELKWLLDKETQYTQEGQLGQPTYSWSQKIVGFHCPEFERSVLSLITLHLIFEGTKEAYQRFTELQSLENKLSPESFRYLHNLAQNVAQNDPQKLKALEVNLLLGDMGKTQIAQLEAKKYGITEADHDLFLSACLKKCPNIFPSLATISKEAQATIRNVVGLVHFGHVTHAEGGPEILTKLKESGILKNNSKDFDFEILTHLCDVSAARGHEDNRGSKVLTEPVFKSLQALINTLHYLGKHNANNSLKYYLAILAEWLGLKGEEKFILARFGAMMRLFSYEEGQALHIAYNKLTEEEKCLIAKEFSPFISRKEKTPTYIPAVLINLLSVYKKQGLANNEAIIKCMKRGAVFIANVLHQFRQNKENLNLTLNFNQAAGQIRDNPELLDKPTFLSDPQGNVVLVANLEISVDTAA